MIPFGLATDAALRSLHVTCLCNVTRGRIGARRLRDGSARSGGHIKTGAALGVAAERIYHVPGGAYYDRTKISPEAGGEMAEVEAMIEVVIERWTGPYSTTEYRWSFWRDGHRIATGRKAFTDADDCETEAEFYVKALGKKPDKVTRL